MSAASMRRFTRAIRSRYSAAEKAGMGDPSRSEQLRQRVPELADRLYMGRGIGELADAGLVPALLGLDPALGHGVDGDVARAPPPPPPAPPQPALRRAG